jgi:hypothetical protein
MMRLSASVCLEGKQVVFGSSTGFTGSRKQSANVGEEEKN